MNSPFQKISVMILINTAQFRAFAVEFSAEVQQTIARFGFSLPMASEERNGPYWGVEIKLPQKILLQLRTNGQMMRAAAQSICLATFNILNTAGPSIPLTSLSTTDPETVAKVGNRDVKIYPTPLFFDDERRQLTHEFISAAYGSSGLDIALKQKAIVLHGVPKTDIDEIFTDMRRSRHELDLNFGVHYLIATDGKIYRLTDDLFVARHAPGLDLNSISVAVAGAPANDVRSEQINSALQLISYLKLKYTDIAWVIDADEILKFKDTPLWSGPVPPGLNDISPIGPGANFTSVLMPAVKESGLRNEP